MKYKLNQVYNTDCVEAMKTMPDNYFHLAIVDPPYGILNDGRQDRRRKNGTLQKDGSRRGHIKCFRSENITWDSEPPIEEYWNELFRVSKNQIVWGVNNYDRSFGKGRIVWDKVNYTSNNSDCEIAYVSAIDSVRMLRYMWNGMLQGKSIKEGHVAIGDNKLKEIRIHECQKPVILYKWLLLKFAKPHYKILDTHGGSLSSIIAAIDFGCDWMAFETDKEYYDNAVKRINTHIRQPKADFDQTGKTYKQLVIE